MFLPLDGKWAIDASKKNTIINKPTTTTFVSPATIAFKLLIVWLYWDAGYGKYSDPLKGWTMQPLYNALPALDTYVRHTTVARYMYGLLGPAGLKYMTPTVPYVEMFCTPIALLGSYLGKRGIVYGAVATMCSMHIGIALTMNNTVLLSLVACVAWCIFLPEGVGGDLFGLSTTASSLSSDDESNKKSNTVAAANCDKAHNKQSNRSSFMKTHGISILIIGSFISGSIWFETMSNHCNQSMEHIWSTLLHCRWNVFVGAEE